MYEQLEGKVDGRKIRMRYRQLFVWSEAKADEAAKTRQRHIDKTKAEFGKIEKNLNKYTLKTREKIVSRLEAAKSKYAAGDVFTYELTERKPMYGIYPENRPSHAPTGRSILEQFEDLSIVIMKHHGEQARRLAELNKVQRHLIDLMTSHPLRFEHSKREPANNRESTENNFQFQGAECEYLLKEPAARWPNVTYGMP